MRCEICGREFLHRPHRAIVEGAKLLVCEECTKHSSSSWRIERNQPPLGTAYRPKPTLREGSPSRRVSTKHDDEDYVLAQGYGARIRKAREKQGWSQEELGLKLNEKASLIGKLETEKVVPNPDLTAKLRRTLNIDLLVKETSAPPPKPAGEAVTHELTLGDVAAFGKRGKKDVEPENSSS